MYRKTKNEGVRLSDNLLSPMLILKCKEALALHARYNKLTTTIENAFFENYSKEDIEEIFNICESYAHPKELETLQSLHKKYTNHSQMLPEDIYYINQAYKANIKHLSADNAQQYNPYIASGQSESTEV